MIKEKIHSCDFLVLEQGVDGSRPLNRVLSCLKFSKQGMILKGKPRFIKFNVTLSIPQDWVKI